MSVKGKIVLCTGGLGYVGSHTVISLFESGYQPIILDCLSNSYIKCLERLEKIVGKKIVLYKADLRNFEEVREVFCAQEKKGEPITHVLHFSSLKAVVESIKYPLLYYENNVIGTINLLKAMIEYKCYRLIFSGSASVYSGSDTTFEHARLNTTNPYGQTKIMIEQMLKDTGVAYPEFKAISLRNFNTIGAHSSGMIGESPKDTPNNVMSILLKVAVGEQPLFEIYGGDYKTRDGTIIRDYIHVQDIAEAHLKALEYIESMKENFDAINLGTGKGTTVMELVTTFEKVNGITLPKKVVGHREGDAVDVTAVPDKAFKLLSWKATRSIEDCCRDCWNWAKQNPRGYES